MAKDIEMQPGQFDVNEVTGQINENVSDEQKRKNYVRAEWEKDKQARKPEDQKQAEKVREAGPNSQYGTINHSDENKEDSWYNKAWKWIKGGVGKAADTLSKPMADAARFVMDLTSIFITGVAWLGRTLFRSGHSKPNYKKVGGADNSKAEGTEYNDTHIVDEESKKLQDTKSEYKKDAAKEDKQHQPSNFDPRVVIENWAKNDADGKIEEMKQNKDNLDKQKGKNNGQKAAGKNDNEIKSNLTL